MPPKGVAPPGGVVAPPGGIVAPPGMIKPGGIPLPGALGKGAGVAPPPFAKKAAPAGPDLSRDPFAVQRPGTTAGEVRLVIDERITIDDKETGRGHKLPYMIAIIVSFVALGMGYCSGSAMTDRIIRNRSVRDAREIKSAVEGAAKVLGGAEARIQQAINMANTKKQADIPSVEYMRSLKRPLDAGSFSRRNYIAFEASTVDHLFEYYNGMNRFFDQMGAHVAKSLADREELTKSQDTINELASSQYGCVFTGQGTQFESNLVIVKPMEGGDGTKVLVQARPSSPTAERTLYSGSAMTEDDAGTFVIPMNLENNSRLLAQTIAPFRDYAGRLAMLNGMLTEMKVNQTQLLNALGDVANLDELMVLGD